MVGLFDSLLQAYISNNRMSGESRLWIRPWYISFLDHVLDNHGPQDLLLMVIELDNDNDWDLDRMPEEGRNN